jgi:hypothetical protein
MIAGTYWYATGSDPGQQTAIQNVGIPAFGRRPSAMSRVIRVALILALVLSTSSVVLAQPSTEPSDPQDECTFFEETSQNLCDVLEDYWNDHGGLPIFGMPLTNSAPELNLDTGETYETQYFERERLEHHPDLEGTPYEVLLGRIGNEALLEMGIDWWEFPKADPNEDHYFEETGQAIAPEFYDYWSSHGLDFGDEGVSHRESLALFGYPISPPRVETNPDGDTVLTQWFERARFEHHPDNDAEHEVLLGRLGSELLELRADPAPPQTELTVLADGLDSPRGIHVTDDGDVYVAESGVGGNDCFAGPEMLYEGAEFCVGESAQITRISDGEATAVLTGLPSISWAGDAYGTQDITINEDGDMFIVVGALGAHEELGTFGRILRVDNDDELTEVADIFQYEHEKDVDKEAIESNPFSAEVAPSGNLVVSDSAMDSVLYVSQDGEITLLHEFDDIIAPLPEEMQEPGGPEEMPADFVPTGIEEGPDGAYYFGNLTGFPFPVEGSVVSSITLEGDVETVETDFTHAIDVAFDSEGRMYVLELLSGGFLNVDPDDPATLASTLYRIEHDGSRTVIPVEELAFATGMAIGPDDEIYVSNLGSPAGIGQVVRIDIDH